VHDIVKTGRQPLLSWFILILIPCWRQDKQAQERSARLDPYSWESQVQPTL
jgi:hypothetical protein